MPLTCQTPRPVVYVHIPKTGGTQTRAVLRQVGGARKVGAGHDSIRVVPYNVRRDSLCVATLRDPWTWYASWYEHSIAALGDEGRNRLAAWGNGAHDFESVLYGVTHPEDLPRSPLWPGVLFMHAGSFRRVTAPHGLLSWCWRYFCCERDGSDAVGAVIDTAQLTAGWAEVLGVKVPDGTANARKSSILPESYADAYSPEMLEWVREADAPIIDRFGFEPFQPLDKPVTYLAPEVSDEQ